MSAKPSASDSVPPGYKRTEVGVIPEEWEIGKIDDLDPFVTSGSRGWAKFYADDGAPFIRIGNLSRDSIYLDLSDLRRVNLPAGSSEGKRTQIFDGDLLISITADIGIIGYVNASIPKPAYINQHIAIVRLDNSKADGKFISYFLASNPVQKLIHSAVDQGAKAGMNLAGVRAIQIVLPPLPEQRAIARALADADAWIEALDRLIAKKRAAKQAAMQALLTGRVRLPGFSGEWTTKLLGDVCSITTGKKDVNEGDLSGQFPFFTCSREYTFSNSHSFDTEAILIAGNGDVGNLHYYNGKFEAYQRTYVLFNFHVNVRYLWYQLDAFLAESLGIGTVGSSIPYIRLVNLQEFGFSIPIDKNEQQAIAQVLSDMDAEIEVLERERDKARAIKQGMMQELLTGRIRLVKPQPTPTS